MSSLLRGAQEALRRRERIDLDEMIDATLGENPCRQLVLQRGDDPESRFGAVCDRKRCAHCGPRKQLKIQIQMAEGFGQHAYVERFDHMAWAKLAIDRWKQQKRTGRISDYTYQIVGDQSLGYIIISDQPMSASSKLRELAGYWIEQILGLYHMAAERIKRSVSLGITRISLLRQSSRRRSGEKSEYRALTWSERTKEALPVDDWGALRAWMEARDEDRRAEYGRRSA